MDDNEDDCSSRNGGLDLVTGGDLICLMFGQSWCMMGHGENDDDGGWMIFLIVMVLCSVELLENDS